MANSIPYSILDISPIPQGFTAADALRNSLDVAQHAENWGYTRYWVAEHHNMTGMRVQQLRFWWAISLVAPNTFVWALEG